MNRSPYIEGRIFGVIALEPAQEKERDFMEQYCRSLRGEYWHVEPVRNRGFVAVRQEARHHSSGKKLMPDAASGSTLCRDSRGFTAAAGFVYRQSHSESSVGCWREDSAASAIHAAYRQHGNRFTARLEGQFCAVGYDQTTDVFWMAGDTFGISRFYYFERNGSIFFSDDVKMLASRFDYRLQPCLGAIHAYFTLFQVPPPTSGFAGIRQLLPNSILLVEGRRLTEYTALWSPTKAATNMTEQDALESLQALLTERLDLIPLQSGVIGLLFSGGIDSSLLGAILTKRMEPNGVTAHALGEADSDELQTARQRAESLRLPFRAWPFAGERAINAEPLTRRWKVPVYPFPAVYIDRFTNEVAQVSPHLVCGSGADGIFLGDETLFRLLQKIEGIANGKQSAGSLTCSLRQAIQAARLFRRSNSFARRFLYTYDLNRAIGAAAPESLLLRVYLDQIACGCVGGLIFQYLAFAHHSIISMYARAVEGLATMHFPFLSKRVIEFAINLPDSLRFDSSPGRLGGKPLLKKLLLSYAPTFPVGEPKHGFGHSISINRWFQPALVNQSASEVLSSGLCDQDWLRADSVQDIFDACATTPRDPSLLHLAWGIYSLAVWFRSFVNQTCENPDPNE